VCGDSLAPPLDRSESALFHIRHKLFRYFPPSINDEGAIAGHYFGASAFGVVVAHGLCGIEAVKRRIREKGYKRDFLLDSSSA
jgi:hypothetical protein